VVSKERRTRVAAITYLGSSGLGGSLGGRLGRGLGSGLRGRLSSRVLLSQLHGARGAYSATRQRTITKQGRRYAPDRDFRGIEAEQVCIATKGIDARR
jgi:hypothetical protein